MEGTSRVIARNFMDSQMLGGIRGMDNDTTYYWTGQWDRDVLEETGTQSLNIPITSDGTIYPLDELIPYVKRRKMLKHPPIALARQLAVAPMTLSEWNIVMEPEVPESARWLIHNEIMKRKPEILERALKDCIDFGWQVNEVVWEPDGKNKAGDDAITIKKFKPLLPYITFLRANPKNGEFAGIKQYDIYNGGVHYLETGDVQLFNIDVEGSNHYGNSMLDNCVESYDDWMRIKLISMGYLQKIAGAHWIVYYPPGTTSYNGIDTDNSEIAQNMLTRLDANGGLAIPSDVKEFFWDQNTQTGERLWSVENITDSGSTSASYVEQLRHFEELICMALMFPPHALLEGSFGTKAEAVVHAEAAVASMEMISKRLAMMLSTQTVNRLLELNFGQQYRNKAWLEVAPITHDNSEFLKQLYTALLMNPDAAFSMLQDLNIKGIGDKLGLNAI